MKKLLKELQNIQDECLGRSKNSTGSNAEQKGDTMIRSVDGRISHQEWRHIHDNVFQHTRDWKRFRSDPNKVVLEKNFLFNSLGMMQNFFIFRIKDDSDLTFIRPKDDVLDSKPKDYQGWVAFIFIILLIAMVSFSISMSNNIAAPLTSATVCVILLMITKNRINKNYQQRWRAWRESLENNPEAFFSDVVTSKRELSGFAFGFIETILKLSIKNHCRFFYQYQKILDKTFHIAAQTKGQIAWLWCFDKSIKQRYSFAIKNITPTISERLVIELSLDIQGSNIIPAIETEHSFIFCLDHFSDEMDEDINKTVLLSIKDRAISQDGNVGKDDLFRAYGFA